MAYRYRFGSKHRDAIWAREKLNAYHAGLADGSCPVCNLCGKPVTTEQAERDGWHESHLPWRGAPAHLRSVGIAHSACNLEHGRTVVVPMLAKSNRIRKTRAGLKGPGLGRYPMRCGVRSGFSKTFKHGVVRRLTGAQKHARVMALRAILTQLPGDLPPDPVRSPGQANHRASTMANLDQDAPPISPLSTPAAGRPTYSKAEA